MQYLTKRYKTVIKVLLACKQKIVNFLTIFFGFPFFIKKGKISVLFSVMINEGENYSPYESEKLSTK